MLRMSGPDLGGEVDIDNVLPGWKPFYRVLHAC